MASPVAQQPTPMRDTTDASPSSTAPTSSTSSPSSSFSPSNPPSCPPVSSKLSPTDTAPAPTPTPAADVDVDTPVPDASPVVATTTEGPPQSPPQSTEQPVPPSSSTLPPPAVAIPLPAPPLPPVLPTSASSPLLPSSVPQPQPQLAPPSAPPPAPPALPPFAPTPAAVTKRADSDQLTPYLGPYDGFQRAAARQSRWMVVVVCGTATTAPANTTTTTTTSGIVRRRYISNSRPLKMHKETVGLARDAPLLLWRRTATSTDLEKYSAFYPIDAYPHIALLDSRTGERMQVWNFEPDVVQEWEDKRKQQKEEKEKESDKSSDEEGADNPSAEAAATGEKNNETEDGKEEENEDEEEDEELPVPVWMTELEHFLESHSLKDDEVGPMHLGQKPAAARTRRVDSSRGGSSAAAAELQPTSIMDDEEAAIATAIAASLKDVEGVTSSDYEVDVEEEDDEDQGDDDNDNDKGPHDEDVIADDNGTDTMPVQPPTTQLSKPDDDGDDAMHDASPCSADGVAAAAEGQTVSAMMDVEQSPDATTPAAGAEHAMDVVVDGDGDDDDEQQDTPPQACDQRAEVYQEQSEREGDEDNSSESDASMDSGLASTSTSTTRVPNGARTKPVPMPTAKPTTSFSSSSSSSSSSSVFLKPRSGTGGTPPTAVPGKTPSRTLGPHPTSGAARTSSPRLASSVESMSSSYLERLSSTLRSSTDPALLESRRLRRMQDEELQASLQSDRAREAKLHQLNMAHARRRAAVMNAQARLAQVSSGPVEIVLRFNDGTRERRAFGSDVMMRTLMDVIVVVTQGNCVCLGDEDVEFGGEDNVSVDRVLRYPLGARMAPALMQKMAADAGGQGLDLAQVSWDHRVVDVINGNRAAFFVQS